MKIENLKELQKVIALCQKSGVQSIKIDGIEMVITLKHNAKSNKKQLDYSTDFPEASIPVPQYNDTSEVQAIADKIATDELTPEQQLFYSAVAHSESQ